jgi:predicted phage tail protein
VLFSCACTAGAGVVLFFWAGRSMLRGAVIQLIFPLLAWGSWYGF